MPLMQCRNGMGWDGFLLTVFILTTPVTLLVLSLNTNNQGRVLMQSLTTTNYTVEFPAFGEIPAVSIPAVQWLSLTLEKPPS